MTTSNKPLSVAQLLVLSTAAQRQDRMVLPLPQTVRVKGASQQRLLSSLLELSLVEELPMNTPQLGWRSDEHGQHHALRLTAAGAEAAGVSTDLEEEGSVQKQSAPETPEQLPREQSAPERAEEAGEPASVEVPTTGSAIPTGKLGQVLTLIGAPAGASLEELVSLTGWLPHTTRAAITRLKQRGYPVQLVKSADRKSYRLVQSKAA